MQHLSKDSSPCGGTSPPALLGATPQGPFIQSSFSPGLGVASREPLTDTGSEVCVENLKDQLFAPRDISFYPGKQTLNK